MKCFQCSGDHFEEQEIRFFPKVKNEIVEIVVLAKVCAICKTPLPSIEQVNTFRIAAADKYRVNHGLLTSQEISQFRDSFRMSQKAFAKYLGVGIASIQRWETYFIQDASQDDHIRVKCDPLHAELNFLKLNCTHSPPDIFNGMRDFSFDLFKQTVLFFIKHNQSNLHLFGQLSFYADFFHFKRRQKSITGSRYTPLKSGPYPDQCPLLFKILERQKSITQDKSDKNVYQINSEINLSLFDEAEKKSLQFVSEMHQKKDPCLISLSRKENGYLCTQDYGYISYQHSKNLLI